ncbi:flagellar hook-length control protein FliK [Pandoraea sp.]|uniref:flagellar hook-length control protein FliK n=1 Tax=Pandoraea sp. TaxID=1883445 RepID=UPI001202353E|nr:flagellar hook-length control protein FliK [Pandoraea sp.]TAL52629.1 MAG: flagellar hook-length control protein FliK [Pandoraea sp.]TAM14289.1 MAG: flagellar hook-length control protein FliK [Pandoraea sp.]
MVGLDSLLASSLARRLDVLMQALDSASPNAVGESASTNVAVAADTPSSTTDGADAQPLNTGAAPPGPPAVLSSAARTIDTLLSLAPDAPGPVTGTEPLWPLPPGDATHALAPVIVAALRQAMDSSGLFYESHLAQWASGGRSLEQLQTEPQTQWPPDTRLPGELPAAAATGATVESAPGNASTGQAIALYSANPAGQPAGAPAPMASAPAAGIAQQGPPSGMAPGAAPIPLPPTTPGAAPGGPAPAGMSAQAGVSANLNLVRQQLEMLVVPRFQWQGEAWPGAPLQWRAEERRPDAPPGVRPAPSSWHTHLRLSLAQLGTVEVSLALVGTQLQAKIEAVEAHTAELLAGGSADLRQRFSATGLSTSQLVIGQVGASPAAESAAPDDKPEAAAAAGAVP